MAGYFRDKVDMAARLFNALKSESQAMRLIVQEATNSLASAYEVIYVQISILALRQAISL